ncbi:hypothetical protein GOODEAATRI_002374 [Goodea atripinnis]|uniref:Uncharacterized protein n=1 Tax=Goodea atripinnis TaxID=208336 RepID=A0ABV0MY28_9TELE
MLHSLLVPSGSMTCCVYPPLENESEGLKTNKLSHLSTLLDKEKKRTELLKEICRENTVLLQRQTQLYLSVQGGRERLECELKACKAEKQAVELKLSSFGILGKAFEALAEEYSRLRQEIDMKNWALKELTQYDEK